ncbi:hypothetical protein [Vagococcus acidifermentans]|uniref:Uncharacterized protein n=1 Tax=Vagococcus acidifermentans TaxID=564710 RepID=A0A430AMF0_9ENTE|nr:hypothetical protein [Vagococcus acidifermentans]RSU09301.1 hypothetical protein CBF27_12875 [Vagococcus acidifermentans]
MNKTRSLKNKRSNKDLLRTEINNATDPNVRLELTKMLVEIEKEETRSRITVWSSLLIILVASIAFIFYLGNKPVKEKAASNLSETNLSTNKQKISETTETSISETNLSEEQLKKWVMSILDLLPPPPTRYLLDVSINDTDNLAYISVGIDQMDGLGCFRVNEKGELEASGRITGEFYDWTLMSDKYLDTTIAAEFLKKQAEEQDKINETINLARSYLIGKKYAIYPVLYDGIDAEQAMNEHKAPQNLIHDGTQTVNFIDDTSIRIELAGTYRPDYFETYTMSPVTLNIKDYYIPYSFNNDSITFSTWTTDIDGHTITWTITPVN